MSAMVVSGFLDDGGGLCRLDWGLGDDGVHCYTPRPLAIALASWYWFHS